PGTGRTFSVTAFDDAGEVTHEGEATVDVEPGQNPPLQVKLGPRSGQVPVTVTFGSWSVVITPASTSLGVGGTAALVAQVLDDEGQPLADPAGLMWATTNPAIAAVDATGTVTGMAPGSAIIVATFEGVAGIATVEVN
ncbi:MAG TPA: Ig-like domain-containing protein, partial [Gemmatimonadales bacterium]|nr:Ig-like domain-containing protein [Gemmatimonadales bacterium]